MVAWVGGRIKAALEQEASFGNEVERSNGDAGSILQTRGGSHQSGANVTRECGVELVRARVLRDETRRRHRRDCWMELSENELKLVAANRIHACRADHHVR